MTFKEKLSGLLAGKVRSVVAERAGLAPTALGNYLNRDTLPGVDVALRIARALEVPLEWLVDDKQGFPAPRIDDTAALSLSDETLMRELARRFRQSQLEFFAAHKIASSIDWERAASEIEAAKPDEPLTDYVQRAAAALDVMGSKFTRANVDYDLDIYSVLHHEELPGADRGISKMERYEMGFDFKSLDESPSVRRFMKALSQRPAEKYPLGIDQRRDEMLRRYYQRLEDTRPPRASK